MTRYLLVGVLAACATTAPPPRCPPAPTPVSGSGSRANTPVRDPAAEAAQNDGSITFESWRNRWGEARACLVEPAVDLDTGIALAIKAGRTCTDLLRSLSTPPRIDNYYAELAVVGAKLAEMIGTEKSVTRRAQLINDLDAIMVELEKRRHEKPEPVRVIEDGPDDPASDDDKPKNP